jgi:hypothetical protein
MMLQANSSPAEPCLLAYPAGSVIFRYDPARYEMLDPLDPRYDPVYGVFGTMLWDNVANQVPYHVYQAPGLAGFEPSGDGLDRFYSFGSFINLIIDGFYVAPRQLNDIYVQFKPDPPSSKPLIYVDSEKVEGLRYLIPRLVVSTPITHGYYSNTISLAISWSGAKTIEIIVYSDRNGNRVFDGEPCFTVLAGSHPVATEEATWGTIKARYRE